VFNSGGGDDGEDDSGPTGSHSPVATITPGPEPSGTHISGRPGGRETSPGDGSASAGATGGSSGEPGGTDTTGGGAATPSGDPTGTASAAGGASSGGTGGTSTAGVRLPAGSTLPDCDPGAVQLTLTSVKNQYSPDETPAFQLRAANSGGTTCKLDFGPRSAVFTVTATDGDHVWASDDCPTGGSYLLQVAAHGSTTFTLDWDGKTSSPQCGTPKGRQAAPATYLVQAKLPGYVAEKVSFVLKQD
jgi:hypothetical protein